MNTPIILDPDAERVIRDLSRLLAESERTQAELRAFALAHAPEYSLWRLERRQAS